MYKIPEAFSSQKLAQLFRVLGQPSHVEILLAIGKREVCVCHLEAVTGLRQAYISQHLMALRGEGLVVCRREGRRIFYRLDNVAVLEIVRKAASLTGKTDMEAVLDRLAQPLDDCPCPHCNTEASVGRLGKTAGLAAERA